MYVEDLLVAVTNIVTVSPRAFGGLLDGEWHKSFLSSVSTHVLANRALSSNQCRMITKIFSRVRHHIVEHKLASADDVNDLIAAPNYRQPPYESSQQIPREVRHIGDNLLAFRCKADSLLTGRIKGLGRTSEVIDSENLFVLRTRPRFDWTYRVWIVPVHRYNINAIQLLLRDHRFHIDPVTLAYLRSVRDDNGLASTFRFGDAEQSIIIAEVRDNDILAGWITDNAAGIVL